MGWEDANGWNCRGIMCAGMASLSLLVGCETLPVTKDFPDSVTRGLLRAVECVDGIGELKTTECVTLENGTPATVFTFCQTQWDLKDSPQSATVHDKLTRKYMDLPESVRLEHMRRIEDVVQIWVVQRVPSQNTIEQIKKMIPLCSQSHRCYRDVAFLGHGSGHSWFAYMPIIEWVDLQEALQIKGGDDPFAAALRGLSIPDITNSTVGGSMAILARSIPRSFDVVREAIATKHPKRELAIQSFEYSKDERAVDFLIECVSLGDHEASSAARNLLLYKADEKARGLYLQWLKEGAGKKSVYTELIACSKLHIREAAPILPSIMKSASSVAEYFKALEFSRELAGGEMPPALREAERAIMHFGYRSGRNYDPHRVREAVQIILLHPDREAAAAVALNLAIFQVKGDGSPVQEAGIEILRRLPGGVGIGLVDQVSASVTLFPNVDDLKRVKKLLASK